MLSFKRSFFANSPWYYLTPYQNLLRLNVVVMVINISKKKSKGGGGGGGKVASTIPLSNIRQLVQSEKFFDGKMSQG